MPRSVKIAIYGVCALLALLFALALQAPASLVPRLLQSSGHVSGLNLVDAQGTLWRGTAGLDIGDARLGRLAWSLSPASLLMLAPRMDWRLQDTGLSGSLQASGETLQARAEGALELSHLTPLLARYAIGAQGRLTLSGVEVHLDGSRVRVGGSIDWSGGRVRLGVGGWQGQEVLPAMHATATDSSRIFVTLWDEPRDSFLPAGEIEFLPDGWVKLGASGHLARRFNQSLGQAEDPDAVVLSVEEQLL